MNKYHEEKIQELLDLIFTDIKNAANMTDRVNAITGLEIFTKAINTLYNTKN